MGIASERSTVCSCNCMDFVCHGDECNPSKGKHMNWELEKERALFEAALKNAIAWQNRCVELWEIIEMFCLDAEAKLKEKNT